MESFLLPIGLLWLGWTQCDQIPWIIPTLAVGCVTMGITSIYLAGFGYLTNTYPQYASSALLRNHSVSTSLSFMKVSHHIFRSDNTRWQFGPNSYYHV
jgi:hypothetical protein